MKLACSERAAANRTCRFRRIDGGGFRLAFEVTRRCDLTCAHCFVGPTRPDPALEELVGLIRQAGPLGCRKLIVTGGEPLARCDLEAIVAAAVEQGMLVDLNSNLYSLTRQRAIALKSAGLQEASVSLYGGQRMHDELTRMPGAFERALHGMDLLREAAITVDVHGAIWDDMLCGVAELVETSRRHGAASISFFSVLPGRGRWDRNGYRLTPVRALEAVARACPPTGIPIRIIGLRPAEQEECVMAQGVYGVSVELRLVPCLLSSRSQGGVDLRACGFAEAIEQLDEQIQRKEWRMACHPLVLEESRG
jgi:MoaA/NifB/PqqE/SkfB family radical SAM enzyme